MSYRMNQKIVSEKAIEDVLGYIDLNDYEGLSTKKEVIQSMLESVEHKGNKGNLQLLTHALVEGGCFRVSNYEILEFLDTLELNDITMKRAKENPMGIYADVLWHAIKRYLRSESE